MQLKHAQAAMRSQNACNASALVHSLSKHMDEIWEEARAKGEGTEYVNTHPLVVFFVTQLSHLSGCGIVDGTTYAKADKAIQEALSATQ